MKINFNYIKPHYNTSKSKYYSNLSPLRKDTVSFSAMKKTQFSGIDLMMINRLKVPIEKFNSNDDFQAWCSKKLNEDYIVNKDKLSESVDEQAQIQKAKILDDWMEYIMLENEAYTPSIQLMILSSITSDLSKDTNHLPPILDKRVLADTIQKISENCKKDKNYNCNFNKQYRTNLSRGIMHTETNLDTSLSGWIVIPSKQKDPDNFEENVKKLQTLSHDNWCTKTYNAEPYLEKGDFHVYMENGKPKLGVRFDSVGIVEIQGEKNNTKIPLKYLDIVKKHLSENNYMISNRVVKEFRQAEITKDKANDFRRRLTEKGLDLETCSAKDIFDLTGIKYEENEEGKLIIDDYRQPDKNYTYEDIGIDEDKLFQEIVEIRGDAYFGDSNVTNLGTLKTITGGVTFENSQVVNLGDLETIQENAVFSYSKITNPGKLKTIGGSANFNSSKMTELGDIETIGGDVDFGSSKITNLGKLKSIMGNVWFAHSSITDLGNLEEIGGNAYFDGSQIISLGKLKSINGKSIGNAKTSQDLKFMMED